MLTGAYAAVVTAAVERIVETQQGRILQAAGMVRDTITADGLIYVFGCGHSHMLAEETFYRAGGLACVSPVFHEALMLHESASKSSALEKESGYGEEILRRYAFAPPDMLICVSTSGVNGVPVEVAAAARKRGVSVVGIASEAYLDQIPRNALGLHLQQVCDVCVDNAAPLGDACLELEGLPVKMTPVSTVTGAFIINSILAEAVQMALEQGVQPPVYQSGNVPGGSRYNRRLIERYQPRIKCL